MNKIIQKMFGSGDNIGGHVISSNVIKGVTTVGNVCITSDGAKVTINGIDVSKSCKRPGKYSLVLKGPDGDIITMDSPMSIQLTVEGDCSEVETTNGDVCISGSTLSAQTTNGDITICGDCAKAKTTNGDIQVEGGMSASGTVTVNGDITFK